MSIMTCNRKNCINIMCDFYSSKYGYICNECLTELKTIPFCSIQEFMDSPKPDCPDTQLDWSETLHKIFTTN